MSPARGNMLFGVSGVQTETLSGESVRRSAKPINTIGYQTFQLTLRHGDYEYHVLA